MHLKLLVVIDELNSRGTNSLLFLLFSPRKVLMADGIDCFDLDDSDYYDDDDDDDDDIDCDDDDTDDDDCYDDDDDPNDGDDNNNNVNGDDICDGCDNVVDDVTC